MKLRSIRAQLGAIFLGFLALVVGAVLGNAWLVQTQRDDATVINLAGRQRMLTQQMLRLALTDPGNPQQAETAALFARNAAALRDGGSAVAGSRVIELPPTDQAALRAILDDVTAAWTPFHAALIIPVDDSRLVDQAGALLAELDRLVQAYENQAGIKIIRLQWLQVIFLAAALALLAWGYLILRRGLIEPLNVLGLAVRDIRAGDPGKPMPPLADPELNRLARTLETMRTEIAAYQGALEQQVARRTGELTAAFEFSQEVVRQLESPQLLQSVADRARELMGGAAAAVCILDADGRTLELASGSGAGQEALGLLQSTDRGMAVPVIREQRTVITAGGCANCGFLHHFPGTSCIAAPLQIGGRSLGALCVVRPRQTFDQAEARILTLLANAAAIGLENTRLIAESRQHAEKNAVLAERQRLAAELHDNLAQTLGVIGLKADGLGEEIAAGRQTTAADRLLQIRTHLDEAYGQVREAIQGLADAPAQEIEWVRELQACLAEFREQTGLLTEFTVGDAAPTRLNPTTHRQVLYIIREALANVRRHARASHVRLSVVLAGDRDAIQVAVVDDGMGFDPDGVDGRAHFGLGIMRARAERSGGALSIQSAPGKGTCLTATIPVGERSRGGSAVEPG